MIRRTTWIMLGIFGLIVLAAWYIHNSQGRETALAIETPGLALLFPVQGSEIVALRISDANGEVTEVRRDDTGEWTLVGLEQGQPDVGRIERAVSNASGIRILSQLETQPELSVIGLDNPLYRIAITLQGGQQLEALIGNLTAMENAYYARLSGERVVVANKFNLDAILEIHQDAPVIPEPEPTPEPDIQQTVEP
jgi:hypothetical protein